MAAYSKESVLTDKPGPVVQVVDAVRPAVTQLLVRRTSYDNYLHPFPGGVGSGVIFDGRGYILTNHHVVGGTRTVLVALPDGRNYQGEVMGGDRRSDLAVVRIRDGNLPVAPLGDSGRLKIGETVVAIGNALGLEGGPTVTVGVVSAKGRTLQGPGGLTLYGLLQTDAAINPGNSGGPLVNMSGQVVGINTAVIAYAQGVGFAIAIESARPVIDSVLAGKQMVRPWLGAVLATVNPTLAAQYGLSHNSGVVVVHVEDDSPAYWSGVRSGDIIASIDGTAVSSVADMTRQMSRRRVGDTVRLTVIRDGQEVTLSAALTETPNR